jgi:hypothetical protein
MLHQLRALEDCWSTGGSGPDERRQRKRPSTYGAYVEEPDSPQARRRAAVNRPDGGSLAKRRRCGTCAGCTASCCGHCRNCLDMPRFGGKGGLRQACLRRACEVLTEEQRTQNEAQREQRATERAERSHEPKMSRRAPRLGLTGGWGEHALEIGAAVEVRMVEDGLSGAVFTGVVAGGPDPSLESATASAPSGKMKEQQARADRATARLGTALTSRALPAQLLCVEYDELLNGGGEEGQAKLRENVSSADLRLRAPPTPGGFARLLRAGDVVELFHEDGWWEVKLEPVTAAGSGPSAFRVSSLQYDTTHEVAAESLRPLWRWWPGSAEAQPCWRFELVQGDGRASSRGDDLTFTFAAGVKRGHNDAQPTAQAGGLLDRVWEQVGAGNEP